MIKKISIILIGIFSVLIFNEVQAVSYAYTDIPEGNWSINSVDEAKKYGIMEGIGEGIFGFGKTIKKSEFVTILNRMFEWELMSPEAPSFSDVKKESWYYNYIETALAHNVIDKADRFNPQSEITREEMAIMLVRALGYQEIAKTAKKFKSPFNDVEDNEGYINVAYDIGMIKGTSKTTFAPKQTAKREEAASMMVNIYSKYIKETDWIHGFYAFSSYDGRDATKSMDAVSVGWSKLSFDNKTGVYLNTASTNGNRWAIPLSYENITTYLENNNTELKLSVYMDTSEIITLEDGSKTNTLNAILLNKENRSKAVKAIINEITRDYDVIEKNPYSGVTIDFEGLKGQEIRLGFNEFLEELSENLKTLGKSLYVTVQPVLQDESYFDGFDYRTIGRLADKVILMAHDYNATSLNGFEGTSYYKTTALTPITKVYYSLKAITDIDTGVEEIDKIALAISFSSIAWKVSDDGKLISPIPVAPNVSTIYKRLKEENTVMNYSETYKNPYITYTTEEGDNIFLWYEDNRSVDEKVKLAKLFGITGVSLWRIGNIPDYSDDGIFYNILNVLK